MPMVLARLVCGAVGSLVCGLLGPDLPGKSSACCLDLRRSDAHLLYAGLCASGASVGLLVGVLLRVLARRAAAAAPNQPGHRTGHTRQFTLGKQGKRGANGYKRCKRSPGALRGGAKKKSSH